MMMSEFQLLSETGRHGNYSQGDSDHRRATPASNSEGLESGGQETGSRSWSLGCDGGYQGQFYKYVHEGQTEMHRNAL